MILCIFWIYRILSELLIFLLNKNHLNTLSLLHPPFPSQWPVLIHPNLSSCSSTRMNGLYVISLWAAVTACSLVSKSNDTVSSQDCFRWGTDWNGYWYRRLQRCCSSFPDIFFNPPRSPPFATADFLWLFGSLLGTRQPLDFEWGMLVMLTSTGGCVYWWKSQTATVTLCLWTQYTAYIRDKAEHLLQQFDD